jgi:pimeloyl-ACP methyl ester carboxylesterase
MRQCARAAFVAIRCLFLLALALPYPGVACPGASGRSCGTTGAFRNLNYRLTVHPAGQPPVAIYAEEMGQGPVLLMLHGLGGSSYTWRAIAPRLASHYRIIAMDLRGFGRSDKPFDRSYGPRDHAAVVQAFIRERHLSQVTLVGHSYGGVLALLLAMDRNSDAQRISRLVLIDTPAYPQELSPGIAFLNEPVLPYVALTLLPPEVPIALALMMEKMGFERMTGRDVAIYADPLVQPGGVHALIETARQIMPVDFPRIIAGYRAITQPTLVLACRDDQVVPLSTARRLSRTVPSARLAVLDNCDHVPPEQAPEAVVAALRAFLGK